MSCPQQLQESNDIIESLKKQLTTFANNITINNNPTSEPKNPEEFNDSNKIYLICTLFLVFFASIMSLLLSLMRFNISLKIKHEKFLYTSLFIINFCIFIFLCVVANYQIRYNKKELDQDEVETYKDYLFAIGVIYIIYFFIYILFYSYLLYRFSNVKGKSFEMGFINKIFTSLGYKGESLTKTVKIHEDILDGNGFIQLLVFEFFAVIFAMHMFVQRKKYIDTL